MRSSFSIILYLLAVLPGYAHDVSYKPLTLTVDLEQSPKESCIGNPVSPICAVKTWESCLAGHPNSCTSIGVAPSDLWKDEEAGTGRYDIRIALAFKFTSGVEAMLPREKNAGGFRWATRGSIVIVYEAWECVDDEKQTDCQWNRTEKVTVSPNGNRWAVTAWEPDNGAICEHFVRGSESAKHERFCAWYVPDAVKQKIEEAVLWAQARGLDPSVQIDPRTLLKPRHVKPRKKAK